MISLVIQHIITCDDPFGDPWPPDGLCSIVNRARGFTLWRRVGLQIAQQSTAAAQSRGNHVGGKT
jgi:hypothetical protein